ncbi:transcription initiation factor TFIID subunit 2 [Rhodotorula toruloides]|uniref:Transcription initiation factor TFIID subunit 2 n=1 Tax=Rhodotorula toruloides TaxID=5286 RepID=A0A511KB41_RHOTO|nr:transcription initiation factor TFIID subunit 2 [Rhodotorula toruloides]
MGKGFAITNQKVSISIGLQGRIHGYTELTIVPTAADLRTVWLHARSLSILSCSLRLPTVVPLAFSHLPPSTPALTQPENIHTYPEMKRQIWRAENEGEEGELGIAIPQGCIVRTSIGMGRTPGTVPTPAKDGLLPRTDEFEPFTVAVEYEVTKPGIGLVVVGPDEANPSRFPHVFTSPISDIGARTWVPCSDSPRERCSWDLELVVPRVLASAPPDRRNRDDPAAVEGGAKGTTAAEEEEEEEDEEEDEEIDAEYHISVIASGELVEQVVHPDRSDRVIWHFVQVSPVSVQQVAWAVGPFVVTEVRGTKKRANGEAREDDEDEDGAVVQDDGPAIHALCLPGREIEMEYSVGVIWQAMEFYTATFGSYPFVTYAVAFVDSLTSASPTFHSAGLTIFSSDILHPPSVIDQAYETRHLLAHALAVQWSGVNLIPRTPSDSWLIIGIALHMTSHFVRHLWGNNEFRFRLKKDINRCVEQDIQFEPICVPARLTLPEPAQMQFIALKAPLVLHILDKHLRKSGTSLGLDKVFPKIFLDAISGELTSQANSLSTTSFMRTCRKLCGGSSEALKIFFDQWVYGSGCPTFEVTANFNRKKMAVELNVTQRCYAYAWSQKAPWEAQGHLRPIPLFDGQMTIRIHEADGTPYEHVLTIQDSFKRHEVPFNTKYKRVRRNTKRYQARQAAATAAALGDIEAQEDMGLIDLGFSLGMWEDEKERERWRVADWTEEDDLVMSQATYEWIRIDADIEWICIVKFTQPDFMWMSQLQRDRDVVAQLEAIHALSSIPSPIVSSNLCKTVLVSNYFFRIRMEAALALISCATPEQQYLGLFHLFKTFQTWYCFEPDVETKDPFGFRCIPKTNDFSDFTLYFMKKALVTAISMIRDERGQTPPVIQQFLVDLLAYNDNVGNKYSDAFYITSVMNALSHALVNVVPRDLTGNADQVAEIDSNENLAPAVQEVERYLASDRLVPSYHNAVTIAGIEFKLKLTLASLIPEDRMTFFNYTRDGNYPPLRIAAFDALLLLNPLQDVMALVRYLFAVMRDDSSRLVQRRLAESVLESLPVLVAIHDLAAPDPNADLAGDAKKERDELANVLKMLRKKPGRSMNYRTSLLQTLTSPDVDPEVRLCCLKICEATVRPEGEPIPKMRFRLPPTPAPAPIPEAPPTPVQTLPKLKLGGPTTPKVTIAPRIDEYTPIGAVDDFVQPHQPYQPYQEPIPPPPPPVIKPPKKPKDKAVKPPKPQASQASGMPLADVTACKSLIKKLLKDKKSFIFRAPVDPVKAGALDYFDKIKNPMDIGTMSAKLSAGVYPDRYAFRDDFKLIISNAKLYNGAHSPIGELANDLDMMFDKHWERVEATLSRLEGGQPSYAAAPEVARLPKIPKHAIPPPPPPPPLDVYYGSPAPAPPSATPTISLKLKAPAPPPPPPPLPAARDIRAPPPAVTPAHSPPPPPLPQQQPTPAPVVASPALPPLPSGPPSASPAGTPAPPPVPKPTFKIKLSGASIKDATPNPPKAASFSPEVSYSPASTPYPDSYDPALAGIGPPKQKKHREPKPEKKKIKGPINYAEPPDLDFDEADSTVPVNPAPAAFAVPQRPEVLDTPRPPYPTKWVDPEGPIDIAKAKSVLSKIRSLREAFFFQYPVEPLGPLATYYDEIEQPMDLDTMSTKLDAGAYPNYSALFSDFDLIVANCEKFNTPNTEPIWHVLLLDRAWRTEWEKANKLTYNTKRSLGAFLKKLMEEGAALPFNVPIADLAVQVPNYHDYIPKEDGRDLQMIKRKLETDQYNSIEALEADFDLMVRNCYRFNGAESQVSFSARELDCKFKAGIKRIKTDSLKQNKRAGSSGVGGVSKKQRI